MKCGIRYKKLIHSVANAMLRKNWKAYKNISFVDKKILTIV